MACGFESHPGHEGFEVKATSWGRSGRPPSNGIDLVLAEELGCPVHPDCRTRDYQPAVEASALPLIHLQDLRHSWGMVVLVTGILAKIASEQMGHTGIAVTLDCYTSVPESTARGAAENAQVVSKMWTK